MRRPTPAEERRSGVDRLTGGSAAGAHRHRGGFQAFFGPSHLLVLVYFMFWLFSCKRKLAKLIGFKADQSCLAVTSESTHLEEPPGCKSGEKAHFYERCSDTCSSLCGWKFVVFSPSWRCSPASINRRPEISGIHSMLTSMLNEILRPLSSI